MSSLVPPTVRAFDRREVRLCCLITVLVVGFHGLNLCSAGALWRDEAGGVGLATRTSLPEMWDFLARDSFPALFPVVLRAWSAVGLGSTDFSLRLLGCFIGLAGVGGLWFAARQTGCRLPWLSLTLFALNPIVIRWGDCLRAYGLGTLFVLLTFGWIWAFACRPSVSRFVLAALGGVLSVQCLYQSAFLVLVMCLGAAVVCWRCRQPRRAGLAVALGLPAALSLLPYLTLLRESQRWWIVEKTGFRPLTVGRSLWDAASSPPLLGPLVWLGLWIVAVVCVVRFLERRLRRDANVAGESLAFAALVASGAALAFGVFVALSGLPTQPWYWVSLLALLGVCSDVIVFRLRPDRSRRFFAALVSLACLAVVFAPGPLSRRITNVKQIAQEVQHRAGSSDLVLVYPWYCGVSFDRYYVGSGHWRTVPDIADHRFHRYDLIKEKLRTSAPLQPLFAELRATLQAGHSVWIVGGLPTVPPDSPPPPELPTAPDGPHGWYDEPYNVSWGSHLAYFIQTQGQSVEVIPLSSPSRVERYEHLLLTRVQGFRGGVFAEPPAPQLLRQPAR